MDTPRSVYKVSPQNPGSDVAAETAAALAAASIVFKESDPSYSTKLLKTAMKVIKVHRLLTYSQFQLPASLQTRLDFFQVFDFADRHRGSYSDSLSSVVCPSYCSYSGYQVRCLNNNFCLSGGLFSLTVILDCRMSFCGELLGFIELHKMLPICLIFSPMATQWVQMMMIIHSAGTINEPGPKFFSPRAS